MMSPIMQWLRLYTGARMICLFLLGFSSGLPLALSGGTLQACFTDSGIDVVTIGLLSLLGLPYLFKFIWAPLFDYYAPPILGRRRGWILIFQLLLMVFILVFSYLEPGKNTGLISVVALMLAFVSASQDIVVHAFQTETLEAQERGIGAAMNIGGYRMAVLLSDGMTLIIADYYGWRIAFTMLAICMLIGVFATLFAKEPKTIKSKLPESSFKAILDPFFTLFKAQKKPFLLFAFLILYKLTDAFTLNFSNVFLLRGLHFTLTELGVINKMMALIATLFGVLIGGGILSRYALKSCLLIFGLLSAFGNLGFAVLAEVGHQFWFACFVIFIENLFGGMATAAFITLFMTLCDLRYTATQFALLTAIGAFGRIVFGSIAGFMAAHMAWTTFYICSFILSLPAVGILFFCSNFIPTTSNKASKTSLKPGKFLPTGR